MTDRAALVEKVAVALFAHPDNPRYRSMAEKAIDLALEEAARELDRWGDIYGDNAAAAIRAMKGKP
jgi:hypothetical protein